MSAPLKTINMLVAALGGEGGGVLTNWLIEVAKRSGWYCQSTSLAGVAQRTGATIYYLEFIPRSADQPEPVMSLFPAQGDIDIAVTSEIAEAGRMISRGFVSPERTTLISSDHRVYGITEKSDTTDGTADTGFILDLSTRYANRFVHFDLLELVQRMARSFLQACLELSPEQECCLFSAMSLLKSLQPERARRQTALPLTKVLIERNRGVWHFMTLFPHRRLVCLTPQHLWGLGCYH